MASSVERYAETVGNQSVDSGEVRIIFAANGNAGVDLEFVVPVKTIAKHQRSAIHANITRVKMVLPVL